MSCPKCGQSSCACGASVLANVQLIDAVLDNPTLNGGVLNGPVVNDPQIIGGTIDCTTQGCTAGPGHCDAGIATNAFVCAEVARQIDSGNPAFCQAVNDCLVADPSALCTAIGVCINGTPGIINNTLSFGIGARATDAVYGVVKYATSNQFSQGICAVAVEPCDLLNFWNVPNQSSPMWFAFLNAVALANMASFNNTVLTGIPTAPTAAAGTCTAQIATTQYVCTAIANAISAANPAFCAAVTACGATGPVDCATIVALFPSPGVDPASTVRFLGTDCMSYTAAQIVSTGGGGGGGGSVATATVGSQCVFPFPTGQFNFSGPYTSTGQGGIGAKTMIFWLGPDDSASPGFALVLAIAGGCLVLAADHYFGSFITTMDNASAATFRAGGCVPNIPSVGCP